MLYAPHPHHARAHSFSELALCSTCYRFNEQKYFAVVDGPPSSRKSEFTGWPFFPPCEKVLYSDMIRVSREGWDGLCNAPMRSKPSEF